MACIYTLPEWGKEETMWSMVPLMVLLHKWELASRKLLKNLPATDALPRQLARGKLAPRKQEARSALS